MNNDHPEKEPSFVEIDAAWEAFHDAIGWDRMRAALIAAGKVSREEQGS